MQEFQRGGYVFDVTDAGDPDGDPVVLLHGFPQDRTAWSEVTPLLNDAGLRTLAFDMRGISPRARPKSTVEYRAIESVNDVTALLDAAGLERAHIVGHDWGGYIAWAMACERPERISTLTVVSTPHPAAVAKAMRSSTQALSSLYFLLFQVPWLPEQGLAPGGVVWRWASRGLPPEHLARYRERLADPEARRGSLAWYRVLPRDLSAPSVRWSRVDVPTMYVWGDRDPALGRTAAEATADSVTGPYRFEEIRAGHWIPETRPVLLSTLIRDHVAGGA